MSAVVGFEQSQYVNAVAKIGGKNLPPGGEATLEYLIEALPEQATRIADLGCNTGWVTARIAEARRGAKVIGVDLSADMIEAARQRQSASNVSFEVGDVASLPQIVAPLDAAVCAGSAAFFPSRIDALRAVRQALCEGAPLVEASYVYEPDTPAELAQAEREMFGVHCVARSAAQWIRPYEQAGLTLRSYRRLPQWTLPQHDTADVYRSILASVPGMKPLLEGMQSRRVLIRELCGWRHPIVTVVQREPSVAAVAASRSGEMHPQGPGADDVLAVMQVFSAPIPRLPMAELRRLLPYQFLAYVGDTDAAPGGAASVTRAATRLKALGLDASAKLLDVGSFTGMSTFALAQVFPDTLGIDIDPAFVSTATVVGKSLGSPAKFLMADARATGWPSASYDATVLTATLGYTPNPMQMIAEAMRLTKPGGFLVEFLYHYPATSPELRAQLQANVGPDVRLSSLSEQVDDLERVGLRLLHAERVVLAQGDGDHLNTVVAAIRESEMQRNPGMTQADGDEFEQLFRRYVGRHSEVQAAPQAYLCIFKNPED